MAGLAVVGLAGILERAPGYMDADYYYASGRDLSQGKGFYQPIIWNYLDDPAAIPHPSHTYWMPLPSLLAAVGLMVSSSFTAARLPFWLLAGLVPPLTVYLGLRLHQDRGKAALGGLFSLFPAFYLAYLPTVDSFALYMLLGSGVLLALTARRRPVLRLFGAGLLAGLMHLARADGILWAALVVAWAVGEGLRVKGNRQERALWAGAFAMSAIAGYLIAMMPWFGRNLALWGSPFPPGGNRTLWLKQYEDMFIYPAATLTPLRWLGAGWGAILSARWQAFLGNFQTWVAVQSSIVLFPFLLVGLWKLRQQAIVRLGLGMWGLTFGLMTVIFPFSGMNGSFFHSGAAFQPFFWAAAPVGITAVVEWLARLRKWERGETVLRFVRILLVIVCVLLSLGIYGQRVVGSSPAGLAWNLGSEETRALEKRLVEWGATPCLTVMVNNPPGYYAAVNRSAVVIPFGDESTLLAVARKYSVSYLLLDENNAFYLSRLYNQPQDYPGMRYLGSLGRTRIYAFSFQ